MIFISVCLRAWREKERRLLFQTIAGCAETFGVCNKCQDSVPSLVIVGGKEKEIRGLSKSPFFNAIVK